MVKVGGGLARGAGDDALRALCQAIGEAASRHRLLVVPGGGGFADAVREHDRRFGLSPSVAHQMGLLAMDQFGWALADLIPAGVRCADLAQAADHRDHGRVPVLLPAALAGDAAVLPASWGVTSDSIAAWCAGVAGAGRLVLVKGVDGLFLDWPPRDGPLQRLDVDELAALRAAGRVGGVDEHLPTALRGAGVEAWVIGGAAAEALLAVLDGARTVGTLVTAPAAR